MPVNVTQDGARQEQRTRYTCRALLPDPHQLQLGKKKVETRVCPNDGTAACETEGKSEAVPLIHMYWTYTHTLSPYTYTDRQTDRQTDRPAKPLMSCSGLWFLTGQLG